MTTLKDLQINNEWCLFLDRDGVINKRIINDYVKSWEEFEFLPGVVDAIVKLSSVFKHIFVVTNQQGIGKGLYTKAELETIHLKMIEDIKAAGGKIDAVYYSPFLKSENHPSRKPAIGMALQAKNDFQIVNFSKCIMVGDMESDVLFGKNAGMKTAFISEGSENSPQADYIYTDLQTFAKQIME